MNAIIKQAAKKIITVGTVAVAGYEIGSNSAQKPEQSQVAHEQNSAVGSTKQSTELWVILVIIIILLIAILVKLVLKKRAII